MTNSILKQQIFMPFFILLLVLLVAFSCLNLYLKKEKVCLYPQLLYYLKKKKHNFY